VFASANLRVVSKFPPNKKPARGILNDMNLKIKSKPLGKGRNPLANLLCEASLLARLVDPPGKGAVKVQVELCNPHLDLGNSGIPGYSSGSQE